MFSYLTSGCLKDELVEGEDFATSFKDSGSCGLSDSQGSNGELGEVQKSDIVSHSSDNDNSSLSIISINLIFYFDVSNKMAGLL